MAAGPDLGRALVNPGRRTRGPVCSEPAAVGRPLSDIGVMSRPFGWRRELCPAGMWLVVARGSARAVWAPWGNAATVEGRPAGVGVVCRVIGGEANRTEKANLAVVGHERRVRVWKEGGGRREVGGAGAGRSRSLTEGREAKPRRIYAPRVLLQRRGLRRRQH